MHTLRSCELGQLNSRELRERKERKRKATVVRRVTGVKQNIKKESVD